MDMDRIWWSQITKASLFASNVIEALASDTSVVLSLPKHVPWYDSLCDIVKDGVIDNGISRQIYHVDGDSEPGQHLLERFCKPEVRLRYRITKSYAAFLAEQEAITLNSAIVWVENLDANSLANWISFIHEYNKKLPAKRQGGIFLLETRGVDPVASSKKIRCLSFSAEISPYDKYTFCTLISASAIVDNKMKPYLAELVSTVCADDVELCAHCIAGGTEFAKDPAVYLTAASEAQYRSDGTKYRMELTEDELRYRIWESQLRMIFPMIERYRMQFIDDHRSDIEKELPITNDFGEVMSVPEDVEIGLLYTLTKNGAIQMKDNAEFPKLRVFKQARNDLAHLTPLTYETVVEILTGNRPVSAS